MTHRSNPKKFWLRKSKIKSIFADMFKVPGRKGHKSNQKIFGVHAVLEAIASGKAIDRVFLKRASDNPRLKELQMTLTQRSIPYTYVPEEKLNREAGDKHQGVLAICALIEYGLIEEIVAKAYEQGQDPLIVILDGVTDVRNLGSICRTAECMGAHAVVVPETGSAQINSEAIKISSGALLNLNVCRTKSLSDTIAFLQESGLTLVGASEKASESIYSFSFCRPVAIIMGSEDKGLSHAVIRKAAHLLRVPMSGQTASLNVSVAAGMILYECMRQRISHS
jgi:23S rRNA (guanosine2251-2'-O)-methyltransferase